MQESDQPITVVTFVPRNHQVNRKTPLVIVLVLAGIVNFFHSS